MKAMSYTLLQRDHNNGRILGQNLTVYKESGEGLQAQKVDKPRALWQKK